MLLSKFFVSTRTKLANKNLPKLRSCLQVVARNASDKINTCPRTHEETNPFAISRAKNYREALKKCPNKPQSTLVCKTDGVQLKRPDVPVADIYVQALTDARRRALDLQIFTQKEVKTIRAALAEESARRSAEEQNRALKRLREIGARVDEIFQMSYVCGAEKRLQSYAIAENISDNLKTWQCENKSGDLRIESRLEALECKVKKKTVTAVGIVRTCHGCVNLSSLAMCVETSSMEASIILETLEKYTRAELVSIEAMRKQVVQENNRIIEKIMRDFEAEVTSFLGKLNECIVELKRVQGKR